MRPFVLMLPQALGWVPSDLPPQAGRNLPGSELVQRRTETQDEMIRKE